MLIALNDAKGPISFQVKDKEKTFFAELNYRCNGNLDLVIFFHRGDAEAAEILDIFPIGSSFQTWTRKYAVFRLLFKIT